MGLTVRKQPLQFKFNGSDQPGTFVEYLGNIRVITPDVHNLVEDQPILIRSNFDAYNGIRFASIGGATSFELKPYPGGPAIDYVNGAGDSMEYQFSVLEHGWQCAHLPIAYEFESDRYPNNPVEDDYTPRTISSIADAQGYMRLNLSTQLPSPMALSFVQLETTAGRSIYQILTVINNYSIVINLAYDASFVTSGVLVSTWYNNYAVHVNVWCGLPAGHRWEDYKPTEIAAELKFVPDADNVVRFSISELIKSYITTRNKLTLDTLPNNIDFWNQFYISYFESWDVSDGDEITTEYFGKDVPGFVPFFLVPLTSWGEVVAGDFTWTGGSNPFTVATGPTIGSSQSNFFQATGVSFEAGQTYKYAFQFTYVSAVPADVEVHVIVANIAFSTLTEKVLFPANGGGSVSDTFEFVCPVGATRLGVRIVWPNNLGAIGSHTLTIDSFTDLTPSVPASTDGILDSFRGIAINAKLPFKSLNFSALSDFLYAPGYLAKFLVHPGYVLVAIVGRFFDISFLNQFDGDIIVSIEKKLSGVTLATEEIVLDEPGIGLLRAPITIESGYDQYCITINEGIYEVPISETICITVTEECGESTFVNDGEFIELEGGGFIELE